jgi:DNA-binding MarR family transcriptional regulator
MSQNPDRGEVAGVLVTRDPEPGEVAGAIRVSIGLLIRRLRQVQAKGDVTLPETSALAPLERGGPATPGALAKQEQISPQSMGATLAALEARGLIQRHPDPDDGRRVVMSLTEAGLEVVRARRSERTEHIAQALSAHFTGPELRQLREAAALLERLAQSI